MKYNRLTRFLGSGVIGVMAFSAALAQQETTTTTTTTTGDPAVVATTVPDALAGTGIITALTPGSDLITFRTETNAEPIRYYYTKTTTVVDPEGRLVEVSALRPNMPVSYTYTKVGDRLIISKITLAQPISYYEKKETTTTTTSP